MKPFVRFFIPFVLLVSRQDKYTLSRKRKQEDAGNGNHGFSIYNQEPACSELCMALGMCMVPLPGQGALMTKNHPFGIVVTHKFFGTPPLVRRSLILLLKMD